jgi:hypothetical protein
MLLFNREVRYRSFRIRIGRIRIRNDLFRILIRIRQKVLDLTGSGSTTLPNTTEFLCPDCLQRTNILHLDEETILKEAQNLTMERSIEIIKQQGAVQAISPLH